MKKGMETARVGIKDNPKATSTALVPVKVFLLSVLTVDDDDDVADGRAILKAGNDCEDTDPSVGVNAGGLAKDVGPEAVEDAVSLTTSWSPCC